MGMEITTGHNSTYQKGGFRVAKQFCAKNPALKVAANR
jgi:hypothetical protein